MSFPGAGLALDIIGAALVAFGLFRHPRLSYPGWRRSPDEAAADRAYGTTGGTFLLLGFTGQLLGAAGLGASGTARTVASAVVALVVGMVAAYGGYGLAYIAWMRYEPRWVARQPWRGEVSTAWAWRPGRGQFWRYEVPRS